MDKKVVYLVRHGQSVDNISPVFQSESSPLSTEGKKQASLIADRLSHISFEVLISSPTLRAQQTATAISSKTGKQIEFSDLFKERIKPQSIDGKPWKDEKASQIWREWERDFYTSGIRKYDGEYFEDILERADKALTYLLKRPEQSLVVVTHGIFLRTIVARILLGDQLTGELLKRIQVRLSTENTAITVLHYRDVFEEDCCWRLWTMNDHAHFAE